MSETQKDNPAVRQAPSVQPVLDAYRASAETVADYMSRAVELLESLYADQDEMIEQLREIFARHHSLRHSDFDSIFGSVLIDRRRTRESLSALVSDYRTGREAVIGEIRELFDSDVTRAAKAWPALKQRLLSETDDGAGGVIAALRRVHMEQEELSTALSALLARAEKLKISDLKTIARNLAGRDSRESAELAALLATCESAALNAGVKWHRLAG